MPPRCLLSPRAETSQVNTFLQTRSLGGDKANSVGAHMAALRDSVCVSKADLLAALKKSFVSTAAGSGRGGKATEPTSSLQSSISGLLAAQCKVRRGAVVVRAVCGVVLCGV
jgi:hypothetical protein